MPVCLCSRWELVAPSGRGSYGHPVVTAAFVYLTDHGAQAAEDGVSSQRAGPAQAAAGRAPTRRADAVQVRRETIPRPLLRQQTQLVRTTAQR